MTTLEVISLAGLLSGFSISPPLQLCSKLRASPSRDSYRPSRAELSALRLSKREEDRDSRLGPSFSIAFIAASIYYAISRKMAILLDHPVFCGLLYGVAVHLVMSRIVVPLSAAPKREFSARAFLTQLIIHICFVGLPIALIVSRFSR